jgi:hypothetical protein
LIAQKIVSSISQYTEGIEEKTTIEGLRKQTTKIIFCNIFHKYMEGYSKNKRERKLAKILGNNKYILEGKIYDERKQFMDRKILWAHGIKMGLVVI